MTRFIFHFGEMVLAMYVGMVLYMPIQNLLPSEVQQVGMALFMAWPMVVWMRVRGHAWQHGFEMAAAMLIPWAAISGLANVLPWLAPAAGAAMFVGMFGYMLARRQHYTHGGASHRRLRLAAAYVGAIVLVPVIVGFANLTYKTFVDVEPMASQAYSGVLPQPPAPDPSKKTAVVLSGMRGAEIGDTLESYEILARSGLYNVYSVAPERAVLPLNPGFGFGRPSSLDFVPHYSFADYDAQIGREPDLIAIPFFEADPNSPTDAVIFDWIRSHFGPDTTILSICSGTMVLADTGLLANRTATTNTGTFAYVQSHSPSTTWLHNLRYVDDGNIITSTNLTGGIDATLHLVDRLAGRATALDVARQIGYAGTAALDDPSFAAGDSFPWPLAVNAAFSGPKERLGVVVNDGVTELGLAGIIDPYVASGTARPFAMAAEQRRIVQSRFGFLFLPRYDVGNAPRLDRVLVPASGNSETSTYDSSLRDMAETQNGVVARAVADGVFYSAATQDFEGAAWPVTQVVTYLMLSLIGAAIVFGATQCAPGASAEKHDAQQPGGRGPRQKLSPEVRPNATRVENGLVGRTSSPQMSQTAPTDLAVAR